MGRIVTVFAVFIALCASACGGGNGSEVATSNLTVLSSLTPIEEQFNADKGHARLVLLLSPT